MCFWYDAYGLHLLAPMSYISGSLMHYLHIHVFVLLLMYLCVRSTGLLLGSVGGSLTYIALLWCVWGLPICPWAVSVDLSCIVSFIVFDVMCVRYADLLLGCVGGPLMHHLVCYGVWWGLPTCSWAVSVGLSLSLSLCRIISFCCGVCGVCRSAHGLCRWISHAFILFCFWCVWGLPTCSWVTSVGLSCIVLIFMVCVWGLPTCSWAVSVGLSFLAF